MRKIRRTRIVVETERLLVVRSRRGVEGRCERCGATARMVGLDEAATVSGRSQRELVRRVDDGSLHFSESALGRLLICLNSLLGEARTKETGERL